jgi:hypothetical protein
LSKTIRSSFGITAAGIVMDQGTSQLSFLMFKIYL